ncbi:ComEC/Rec2 family competence protein [Novosphingobium sp.]|uniref:ComEC/Rec2 family competence protein n=1 Tax=Novosphingobium sp. TaxID=1874826 RepID=UPI0038B8F1A8
MSRLSSVHRTIDRFLADRPFERGPWLVVAFGVGIAAWAFLPDVWEWLALLCLCSAAVLLARLTPADSATPWVPLAIQGCALMAAAGCATIWTKSSLVGAPPIARSMVVTVAGTLLDRQDEGALGRIRLVMATRVAPSERPIRIRLNLDTRDDLPGLQPGAVAQMRVRLVPPAPPMLPGAYDFARAAWFQGLAATGSVLGKPRVLQPAPSTPSLLSVREALAAHVRANLAGSPGAIAAAFASGDRGAITPADEQAMRDAGLTHLLSISGLHVSAVIAGFYLLAIRVLALLPWIALRVRLPVVAASVGALAGIAYALITGAEVPTVRSVVGALLVLGALALGRDPLSLRMTAIAALFVMIFWPESVLGPSFQMSFASVIAIVAMHQSAPVRAFIAHRESDGRALRLLRHLALLLATGVVIELSLLPIALFHFHRAGVYGAFANVIAIPLTTFLTMPLLGLALVLDFAGLGAPAWWAVGKSLDALIGLAHVTAALPGAVTLLPTMPRWVFGLWLAGLLWLALWTRTVRLYGLLPITIAATIYALERTPDILVSGDGHYVGITGEGPNLIVLRPMRGDYARSNLLEMAGMQGDVVAMDDWAKAKCNVDFCAVTLDRQPSRFRVLLARGTVVIDELALAAACERSDLVIADRRLPQSCRPRLLRIDRSVLEHTGGLTVDLKSLRVTTVAQTMGHQGWYPWFQPRAAPIHSAPVEPDHSGTPTVARTVTSKGLDQHGRK